MEKMTGKSIDLVAERIEQLKALMPEAFVADGKIDFDVLKCALGEAVDSTKEHYRFIWNGKEEARAFALRPSMGTLRPCVAESAGKDGTAGKFDSDNIYIEGDNLEVLKLLQGSYHNAVKMIYIDPPYNTGHDFVYEDDFSDSIKNYKEQTGQADGEGKATHANAETSGRYHTDWLNMMFPRLLLARNLLRDDGVIFISIDDNEVTNLRKLCDEVFGETNFVAQVVWERAFAPKNDAKYLSESHDYVLVYARNVVQFKVGHLPRTDEATARYKNVDNDPRGLWVSGDLTAKTYSAKYDYSVTTPNGTVVNPSHGSCWRVSKERMEELRADNRIWFGEDGGNVPRLKRFLSEIQDGMTPTTLWFCEDVGHNQEGRQELKKLFDDKGYFDGPKPIRLMNRILQIANTDSDSVVLDFFSGSASTAHAVAQLNSEDGGRRKFIMVQLPEACEADSEAAKAGYKNICEIGKERIRRAGKKILAERKGKEKDGNLFSKSDGDVASPLDVGFKVFKLDTSNIIPWNPNPEDLKASLESVTNNVLEGRSADDLLYEILLKCNLSLTLPIEKKTFGANTINVVGEGALMICLDNKITAAIAEEMVRLRDEVYKTKRPMQVVFLDNGFTDNEKANAIAALVQAGVEEKSILSI